MTLCTINAISDEYRHHSETRLLHSAHSVNQLCGFESFKVNFLVHFLVNFRVNFLVHFLVNFRVNFLVHFLVNFQEPRHTSQHMLQA
ncbi:unnamed protein product [Gadus morhua 'NCC']